MTHAPALLETAKAFYDAKVWAKLDGFIEGNPRVDLAWDRVQRWASPSPRRVLEIGCGIGDICWRMGRAWPNAEVVGLDLSSKTIEVATKLFGGPQVRFVHGAVTSTDVWGTFDLIVMLDVYEHIPAADRWTLHSRLEQSLAEDGRMVLSFPTPEHLDWLREHHPEEIQPVDEDITPDVILALAKESRTSLALYQRVNVWHRGDYAHAVLTRQPWIPHAAPHARPAPGRLQRYLWWRQSPDRSRAERRDLVRRRLGIAYDQRS